MIKKLVTISLITAISCCIIALVLALIIDRMVQQMVIDDQIQPADLIVVISGEKGERAIEGISLYQEGMGKKLLFSGGRIFFDLTTADLMLEYAIAEKIPENDIQTIHNSSCTIQDANLSLQTAKTLGAKKVIVVTSPYHIYRTRLIFKSVYPESIEIAVRAVKDAWFKPKTWWHTHRGQAMVFNEFTKLLAYRLGFGCDPFPEQQGV